MSSPEAFGDPSDTSASEEEPSSTTQEQDTVVETTECPNCGRRFVGDYCPACGQEADPSASVLEVIGGFFRELVDVESGFWPTFVGLSLRPGKVLRDYLDGVRAGLISPGRYLVMAVVVDVAVDRLFAWLGDEDVPWADPGYASSADGGTADAFHVALNQLLPVLTGPETRVLFIAVITGLLAALLYRLFGDVLERVGDAFAVASFLLAHVLFLDRGADLLYGSVSFLWASSPSSLGLLASIIISSGYMGFTAYRAFGPQWTAALAGGFVGVWVFVEIFSVVGTSLIVYAVGLALVYPETYKGSIATMAVSFVLFALPLLLHAGVELYLRYRK